MSAKENEQNASACHDSDDLGELLKSALDDFDEPLTASTGECAKKVAAAAAPPPTAAKEKTASKPEIGDVHADFEAKFANLLLAEQDDASFSNKMTDLLMAANKEIQRSGGGEGGGGGGGSIGADESGADSSDAVSQAINSLVENIEEIKDSLSNDQFPNSVDLDGFKNDAMFPMMEQMFQMLMSKEVLYPSLVAVRDQYPVWLEENSDKISAQERDRYSKQFVVVKKICVIFESENENDSEEMKQKKFIELLGLLEEMTALGQPPSDFAESLPSMSGINDVPDSCNTM